MNEKIALVTGASSGIGEATSFLLAAEGYTVIAVARRAERLKRLTEHIEKNGGKATFLATDLTDEEACRQVFREVRSRFGDIDVLVNNAGVGWYGYGDEMAWHQARQMIELNIAAVANLTLLFLGEMKRRNQGHIINVSSIAGSLPSQGIALYSGSKSFVDSFTTSLHRELKGTNVHISLIKPGAVTTPFFDTAAASPAGRRIPVESMAVSPEAVAGRIVALIKKPKRVVYIPRFMRLVPWVEMSFGWLIDMLGPYLLRRQLKGDSASH